MGFFDEGEDGVDGCFDEAVFIGEAADESSCCGDVEFVEGLVHFFHGGSVGGGGELGIHGEKDDGIGFP